MEKGENADDQDFLLFPPLFRIIPLQTNANFESVVDSKLHVLQKMRFVFDRVENITGKENETDYNGLLFPPCVQTQLSFWSLKERIAF